MLWVYSTLKIQQHEAIVSFRFRATPKIKGSSHKKKLKIFIFSKMAQTIFIKFCGFIAHSNLNNMALSAFP